MLLRNYSNIYINLIAIFSMYGVLNIFVSKMSISGISINLIGILVLLITILSNKKEMIFIFFIYNLLIGPFMLVNFSSMNLDSIGRLDYLIANLLILNIILNRLRIEKFVFLLYICLLFSLIMLSNWSNTNLDIFYRYISKISFAYILYYFWINIEHYRKKYLIQMIFVLLLVHCLISCIQLFYPFYLRGSTIEAGLNIFGHTLNRPVGLLATSFTYGMVTLFSLFFYIHLKNSLNIFDKLLIVTLIVTSSISTRSALLGLIVFTLFYVFRNIKLSIKAFLFILFTLFVVGLIALNYQLIFLEQSNSTKFLLWFLAFNDFINNFTLIQIFFGKGIESSLTLASLLPDFVNQLNFEAIYDNRIDKIDSDGKFPIHNVYIQLLYEHGIILFGLYVYFLLKILVYLFKDMTKNIVYISIIFFVTFFNDLFHNGIFGSYTIFTILVFNYYIKLKKV